MTSSVTNPVKAFARITLGLAIAAMAAFAAFRAATVAAPLFAQPPDVRRSASRRPRHNGRQQSIARGR